MESKLRKKLHKNYPDLKLIIEDRKIIVSGEVDKYSDLISACQSVVHPKGGYHVVCDIKCKEVIKPEKIREPQIEDKSLDGKYFDVVVIGGGISGASILRELSRYNLKLLLIEKENDLAMQASGRNDGQVHVGVDLKKGLLKQSFVVRANQMYDRISKELNVPFKRYGQLVGISDKKLELPLRLYALEKKYHSGIPDAEVVNKKRFFQLSPYSNKNSKFGLYNKTAGVTCPYNLTIGYAENAIENGAMVSLNTMVKSMDVKDKTIQAINTNRGKIKCQIVINAAGVFAEEISKMCDDRFYSIHPRKGTDIILDKGSLKYVKCITSYKDFSEKSTTNSKGGGILPTVDGNVLVGPNAVEQPYKEDYSTTQEAIDSIMKKQQNAIPNISKREIITYFSGIRAANFEEDYVIEFGRNCSNIFHCACIQSPGLTTAPAVAEDVSKIIAERLHAEKNLNFNPIRKGYGNVKELSLEERDKLIKSNPNYGIMICRCEEISKGEILDCIHSSLPITSIDQVKRRVRPGMGRCQGGFCQPLVHKILAEEGVKFEDVTKNEVGSNIVYGDTKGGDKNAR
jgi:glycerol-3-phosphate dehydrogenase